MREVVTARSLLFLRKRLPIWSAWYACPFSCLRGERAGPDLGGYCSDSPYPPSRGGSRTPGSRHAQSNAGRFFTTVSEEFGFTVKVPASPVRSDSGSKRNGEPRMAEITL